MQDYYSMLALSAAERISGVQAAYRDFIRTIGDVGTPARRAEIDRVVEAFSVLTDSSQRRLYDEQMRRTIEEDNPSEAIAVARIPSILADRQSVHPSFEELMARLLRNYTNRGVPKSEHAENLTVEVKATSEQPRHSLDLGVPVFHPCPFCQSGRAAWPFPCRFCDGTGRVEHIQPVHVAIPPRLPAETQTRLDEFGIHNFYMTVHFTR